MAGAIATRDFVERANLRLCLFQLPLQLCWCTHKDFIDISKVGGKFVEQRVGCSQYLLPGRRCVVGRYLDIFLMEHHGNYIQRDSLNLMQMRGKRMPEHMRLELNLFAFNGLEHQ